MGEILIKSEMLKVERSKGSNLLTEDQFSNKKITGLIKSIFFMQEGSFSGLLLSGRHRVRF